MLKNRLLKTGVLVLIFAMGSGAAYAFRPFVASGETAVSVCVSRANGDMHAIPSGDQCKSSEEMVVLALAGAGGNGATGATGPQGPQGDTGVAGPVGATGAQGVNGLNGATGAQGAPGVNGATGAQGAPGVTGATGAQGVTGLTGATGSQGPSGTPGAVGATGAQGPVGATGAAGTNGAPGPAGATGAAGAAGTAGQDAVTVSSTAAQAVTSSTPVQIPGLAVTVTAGSNSVLYVSTDGGIVNNGLFTGDYVQVSVRVKVDGVVVVDRPYEVEIGNFASKDYWNIAFSVAATPGSHTVTVDTFLRDAGTLHTTLPTAIVGGPSNSMLRGELTVLTLNK